MATAAKKTLLALTAGDLMTDNVVCIPHNLSVRDAARLLVHTHISGAPVIDAEGKCIGVFSATDFLRRADRHEGPAQVPLPPTCSFAHQQTLPDGREATVCSLAPGLCPLQGKQAGPDKEELVICTQPHCLLTPWQMVSLEKLPVAEVGLSMTPDPVSVEVDTPIRRIARMMIDTHIHRVIVVVEGEKPVGIVSSTDLLAALAYAEDD